MSSADLAAELELTKQRLVDAEAHFAKLKSISRKALDEFNRVKDDLSREQVARADTEDRLTAVHDDLVKEATRRKHLEQLLQATANTGSVGIGGNPTPSSSPSPHASPRIPSRHLHSPSPPPPPPSSADESLRRDLRATEAALAAVQKAAAAEAADRKRAQADLAHALATVERLRAQRRDDREYIEQLEALVEAGRDELRAQRRVRDELEADLVAARDALESVQNGGQGRRLAPPARPARPAVSDEDSSDVAADVGGRPVRRAAHEQGLDADLARSAAAAGADGTDGTEGTAVAAEDALSSPRLQMSMDDRHAGSATARVISGFSQMVEDDDNDSRDSIVTSVVTAMGPSSPFSLDDDAPPLPAAPPAVPAKSPTAESMSADDLSAIYPVVINPLDVPREASLPGIVARPPRFASIPMEGEEGSAPAAVPNGAGSRPMSPEPAVPNLTREQRKAMLSLSPGPQPPTRGGASLTSPKVPPREVPQSPTTAASGSSTPPSRKTTFEGGSSPMPSPRHLPADSASIDSRSLNSRSPVLGSPLPDRSDSPAMSARDLPHLPPMPSSASASSGGTRSYATAQMDRRPSFDGPLPSPSRDAMFTFTGGAAGTGGGAAGQGKMGKGGKPVKGGKFGFLGSAFTKMKDKVLDEVHMHGGHYDSNGTLVPNPGMSSSGAVPAGSLSPNPSATPRKLSATNIRPGQISSPVLISPSPSPPTSQAHRPSDANDVDAAAALLPLQQSGDKSHIFVSVLFTKIVKCALCGDRIWGMGGAREMSCRCCGLIAHTRCAPSVQPRCPGTIEAHAAAEAATVQPASSKERLSPFKAGGGGGTSPLLKPAGGKLFNTDLVLVMADKPPGTVPLVVERCIAAVEAIGMDMEGVYRKSAPHMLLKQAVADFDRGLVPNLADEDIYGDVTVATSLLKQYLRDLPNPLITFGVYPLVKEAMRATEEQGGKVAAMRRALAQLPPAHATTLTYLFAHLRRVVDRASENRMTSHNVGVVFGPSLMSGQSGADAIFDMASIDVVEFLVTNQVAVFDGLFPTPAPPPPAAAVSGDASTEPSADVPLSRSVGSQPLGGGSGRIGSPGPLPRLNLPSLGTADGLMDFSLLYLTDNVSLRGTPASEIRRPSLAAGDTSRQPYAPSS